MPAYLIVNYTIEDLELYKSYQREAVPSLGIGTDCMVRVLDGHSETLEGDAGQQTVVLEFESKKRAKEIYESGQYQAVLPNRLNATSKHFAVLVDSFERPS